MIGERREARTKSQAQRAHRNVGIKGHSKLLAVPFNSFVILFLAVLFKHSGCVCVIFCLDKVFPETYRSGVLRNVVIVIKHLSTYLYPTF